MCLGPFEMRVPTFYQIAFLQLSVFFSISIYGFFLNLLFLDYHVLLILLQEHFLFLCPRSLLQRFDNFLWKKTKCDRPVTSHSSQFMFDTQLNMFFLSSKHKVIKPKTSLATREATQSSPTVYRSDKEGSDWLEVQISLLLDRFSKMPGFIFSTRDAEPVFMSHDFQFEKLILGLMVILPVTKSQQGDVMIDL